MAGSTKHDRYFIECPPPSCIVGLFGGQPVILETIINPGYILPTLQGDRTTKHDRYFIECPPPSCIVGLFGGQPVILETIINPGYILPTLQGDRTRVCRFGMFKAIRANIVSSETTEDEVAQVQ